MLFVYFLQILVENVFFSTAILLNKKNQFKNCYTETVIQIITYTFLQTLMT